jgi:protein tyrosine/serine phosphatase
MNRRVLSRGMNRSVLAALVASFLLVPAFAGPRKKSEALVDIDNFGQINDHIYRGGQPKGDNFRQLAGLGVKTIIDLRGDSVPGERASAEAAGLRYINLPLADKQYPQAGAAQRFLDLVNDPANGVVYVHCAGGRHRTGAMVAVYRMSVDGWDIERAYQEMKDYDFYTSMGHGCYKVYVYEYYRDWQAHHQGQPAANAATAPENKTVGAETSRS